MGEDQFRCGGRTRRATDAGLDLLTIDGSGGGTGIPCMADALDEAARKVLRA